MNGEGALLLLLGHLDDLLYGLGARRKILNGK